eukprot:325432-Amphidinium_carterae.1
MEDECVLQLIYTSTPKKVWTLEYVTTDPKSGPTGDVDSARSCRSRCAAASLQETVGNVCALQE